MYVVVLRSFWSPTIVYFLDSDFPVALKTISVASISMLKSLVSLDNGIEIFSNNNHEAPYGGKFRSNLNGPHTRNTFNCYKLTVESLYRK